MTSLAGRRRRRRRIAVAAVLAVLLAGLAVVGSFWQRSVRDALRAEAANLLALGQLELEEYPTATVAYATASLELADNPGARHLALEALWKGPTAFVVNEVPSFPIAFTPDGRWLVQATDRDPHRIHVIGADGTDELLEDVHDGWVSLQMDSESGVFSTRPVGTGHPWALWSAPEKRLLAKGHSGLPDNTYGIAYDLRRRRALLMRLEDDRFVVDALSFDGTSELLGTLPFNLRSAGLCRNAHNGKWFAVSNGQDVYMIEFGDHDLSEPRRLDLLEGPVSHIECDPLGRFVAARYEDGQVRLWDLVGESPPRVIEGPSGRIRGLRITDDGSLLEATKLEEREYETWIWSLENEEPAFLRHKDLGKYGGVGNWILNPVERQIVSIVNPDPKIRIWPLRAPADAEPVILQRGGVGAQRRLAIHPAGGWLATSGTTGLTLWPVARPYPIVINRYEERASDLVFGPEGRWLATSTFIWKRHG